MNERQIHVLGAKIDLLNRQEVFSRFQRWLNDSKGGKHIVTLNPEIALLCEQDDAFHKVINRSALTLADGVGLRLAAQVLGQSKPPRITGRMVLDDLCRLAVQGKKAIYLVGGEATIADRVAKRLVELYPGLSIVGAEQGMTAAEFGVDGPKARALAQRINASKAAVVFVAFGAPKQENWIAKHLPQMPAVRVAVGVGGLFDYVSGAKRQPSVFWQKAGLEWFYRLVTQPRRWRRIFNATIVFITRVFVWKFRIHFFYRRNVVACILHQDRKRALLVTPWWSQDERWQFPQGGVDRRESPSDAVLREMGEELGTRKFRVLRHVSRAHRYTWPRWYQFVKGYRGQDQDLFILEFTGTDADLNVEEAAELQRWKWVPLTDMLHQLAAPRREVGQIALRVIDEITN